MHTWAIMSLLDSCLTTQNNSRSRLPLPSAVDWLATEALEPSLSCYLTHNCGKKKYILNFRM